MISLKFSFNYLSIITSPREVIVILKFFKYNFKKTKRLISEKSNITNAIF